MSGAGRNGTARVRTCNVFVVAVRGAAVHAAGAPAIAGAGLLLANANLYRAPWPHWSSRPRRRLRSRLVHAKPGTDYNNSKRMPA